ncbi:MAG TPA: TetR/AcrR family transcriptional regulator [Sporichthyaceae bacterium]|jgi:TetR/AcrR family transcriptional repressor of lmrAB and yxaGH operons|nr:TetR/AcrR family transcriptional regulator [Sporichthyaceae bacterium]
MVSRTDVRQRMVSAGEELLSHRGYGVTMLDVVERAQAPRGSIYYHFPNGKQELALDVAAKVTREVDLLVSRTALKVPDATAFLQRLVEHHCKRLIASGYELGCPLMGIIATGEAETPELAGAVDLAFSTWIGCIADALTAKGFANEPAAHLANLVVSGIEGCIMVARARRSPAPFVDLGRSIPLLVAGALAGVGI